MEATTGPQTREEFEQSTFYKAGAQAKKSRIPIARSAIRMMRPGTWQYEAFIAGYDAPKKAGKATGSPTGATPTPAEEKTL